MNMDDSNVSSPSLNAGRCKIEHETVEKEIKREEKLEISTIYRLNNTENLKEEETPTHSDAVKDVNAANKYIKELLGTGYGSNKNIASEQSRASNTTNKHKARYEANKDAIKERSRQRYEANKDAIKERSRAKYAANKDKAKARYEANKDIFKERAKRKYEANKDAIKERSRARYAANRGKAKARCEINTDNIEDLSSGRYDAGFKLADDRVDKNTKQKDKVETNAIYILSNLEEIVEKQKPRNANRGKARYETNKDIVKDVARGRFDMNCKSEHGRVNEEIAKEKVETNAIYRVPNIEEIQEKQKPRYAEKKKARYEANKDIIKERSRRRYWANNDILKERARAKYAANKDVRERNRSYYKANKDHINEQKRARRAAKSDDTKARHMANKKIIEDNYKLIESQKKEKLTKTPKMWLPEEETALIDFLKENEFLKPTARTYYNRFLQISGVKADWRMVRSKMFTMRRIYKKTKDWLNTMGAAMTDEKKIRNAVRSKFRFYYDFEVIFGSNSLDLFESANFQSETISDHTSNEAPITVVKTENEEFQICYDEMPSTSHDKSFSVSETLASHPENQTIKNIPEKISTTCCSRVCLCSVVSEMVRSRAEILTLGMEKTNFDTILREREMQLLERQVTMQENELELKKKELISEEHLKMIELQMKEKLAITELELKYKN